MVKLHRVRFVFFIWHALCFVSCVPRYWPVANVDFLEIKSHTPLWTILTITISTPFPENCDYRNTNRCANETNRYTEIQRYLAF